MDDNKLNEIRHSLAHLLAMAVLDKYPGAKLAIGPAIDTGFYYDFEFPDGVSPAPEDLKDLQKTMKKLAGKGLTFSEKKISADEAREMFANAPYKLELIEEFTKEGKDLTTYTSGDFTDLCRGGHIENSKEIDTDAFKLTHIAGAYWRGDEKNKMLTRIYGLAFESKEKLDEYLAMQEEAKKRDHRKLGKELGLYTIIDEIGSGLPMFYPKGAILRRIIEDYISKEQEKKGYEPIWIPHITKGELYKISGHLDKYDAMYNPMEVDGEDYYIKPMNCPHFMMLYKSLPHSYKELPIRYVSTTTNYRYEKSGELNGLTRVRALTQDDCHVFCTYEQIEGEISTMLEMIESTYKKFELKDFWISISLRDKKNYIGDESVWNKAEDTLRKVVKDTGLNYKEMEGEAAFYGPKLDFMFKDALGREWQLSTIQLDFNLPERFELEYKNTDNEKTRPVVIHRAILGSTERFLGILIEHYAGAFPVWLSPVQVAILPIADAHKQYAKDVFDKLKEDGARVELHDEDESLGKKIRDTKIQKVPYFLVIGDEEIKSEQVMVESRDKGKLGAMSVDDFAKKIQEQN